MKQGVDKTPKVCYNVGTTKRKEMTPWKNSPLSSNY